MSLRRVRVEIPKVRRNSGEVRSYKEVSRPGGISDNALLWGTACLLFALTLGSGAYLWHQAQVGTVASVASESRALRSRDCLVEAREAYIRGEFGPAVSSAQLALALEQAQPSQPPLEGEVRRILALAHQSQGQFSKALEQWEWLKASGGPFLDQESVRRCREALDRAQQKVALEQLKHAQQLRSQRQSQRALAEARQALRLLERHRASKDSLRAALLLVAQLAAELGDSQLARESLQAAAGYAPLSSEQKSWLGQLEKPRSLPSPPSRRAATARVLVPSLGEGPHYPLGSPSSRRNTLSSGQLPGEAPVAEMPPPRQPASAPPGKKFELPRLEMPDSSPNGSLPSYSGNGGKSLPSYSGQKGDSLPTYSGKPQTGGKLPGY